jgi:hypothetical protein
MADGGSSLAPTISTTSLGGNGNDGGPLSAPQTGRVGAPVAAWPTPEPQRKALPRTRWMDEKQAADNNGEKESKGEAVGRFVDWGPPPDLRQRALIFDSLTKIVHSPPPVTVAGPGGTMSRTLHAKGKEPADNRGTYIATFGAGFQGQLGRKFQRGQKKYSPIPVTLQLVYTSSIIHCQPNPTQRQQLLKMSSMLTSCISVELLGCCDSSNNMWWFTYRSSNRKWSCVYLGCWS